VQHCLFYSIVCVDIDAGAVDEWCIACRLSVTSPNTLRAGTPLLKAPITLLTWPLSNERLALNRSTCEDRTELA
jgi:hypothetical protein